MRRYLSAQLAGDRREGLRLLAEEGLGKGLPVRTLHLEVIAKAQHEIGRLWQENVISIAQEHVATAISQLVLSHLYQHLPRRESNGRMVMVACVEGEQHEMGARIIADFLEMDGFDVRYLGANVPAESLADLARVEQPDLLALSVSLTFNLPGLRKSIAAVRALMPSLPIAAGGHAFTWDPTLPGQLELAAHATDAERLVDAVRELFRGK